MSNDNTSQRKRRRGSRTNYWPWIRLLIRLVIVGVIVLAVFLLVNNWRKIMPISFLDWYDQTFDVAEKGEEFPYTIDGSAVIDMIEVNPHLVVLDKSSVKFFTDNASCVVERAHPFADPTLDSAGEYALITEIGGSRFQLETRRETVYTGELANRKIYAGAVTADGVMAFVLNSSSQSYLSEIRVVDVDGKTIFEHQSSKYLLCDVSLSPDGSQLTAVGTSSEGGMLKSAALIVDLEEKSVVERTGSEVLIHTVSYLSDSVVLAVGDREVWTISGDKQTLVKTNCDGVIPVGYAFSETLACVALRRDGATDSGVIWLFDGDGELVKQAEYNGTLRSVTAYGGEVLALTDSSLYRLTSAGVKEEISVPSDCLLAVAYGEEPMVLTFGELKRLEK